MSTRLEPSEAEDLMSQAFALLKEGKAEEALAIGKQLEKGRYSGGFEIQALAYQDLEENKKAIRVLKKGTKKAPDVWLLWQLLGSCLSDEGAYEEALAAYEAATPLRGADLDSLAYNRAIVLWRTDCLEQALAVLHEVVGNTSWPTCGPKLQLHVETALLGLLNDLDRQQEAIEQYASFSGPPDPIEYPAELAVLEARYGLALWKCGRSNEAEATVRTAIWRDKTCEEAQWLLREMRRGENDGRSTHYELQIHGPWNADAFSTSSPAAGFYVTYYVVAENLEEAMTFVREFEPEEVREALTIEEVRTEEPSSDPKGVYWTSAYHLYAEE